MAARLPDWKGLLRSLAKHANMSEPECEALGRINSLDQATIIERRLKSVNFGNTIKNKLGKWTRYSLTHSLLPALPVKEVITTNYDELFEKAWGHMGSDDLTILPTKKISPNTRRWLFKMHGCLSDPQRIVLTRSSYTRYDETLPALAGIVQSFLISDHTACIVHRVFSF